MLASSLDRHTKRIIMLGATKFGEYRLTTRDSYWMICRNLNALADLKRVGCTEKCEMRREEGTSEMFMEWSEGLMSLDEPSYKLGTSSP